jgi:hypothetical protein
MRGILFVVIAVLGIPLIVSGFALLAALLNQRGDLATVLSPDSAWLRLVSFLFRMSMIPGTFYLAYRGLRSLTHRRSERRLFLMLACSALVTTFLLIPPRPRPGYLWSAPPARSENVQQVGYKIDKLRQTTQPVAPNFSRSHRSHSYRATKLPNLARNNRVAADFA